MTWQEELRKLDEELAAGRLSADDYRVRRDQVLSSAVAPGEAEPEQTGNGTSDDSTGSTQIIAPVPPASAGPPSPQSGIPQVQPGPQSPQQGQPAPSAPSTPQTPAAPLTPPSQAAQQNPANQPTQWQHPTAPAHDPSSDRTQAVTPGWPARPANPNDPDRTQVVPGQQPMPQGPVSPAGGFAAPPPSFGGQQPQWGPPPQQQDVSPPWGGGDWGGGGGGDYQNFQAFKQPQPSTSDWVKQGPETFETEPKSKKGWLVALIVVVVLGLGAGAWFLFLKPKDNNTPQANPPASSSTQAPPPPPAPPKSAAERVPTPPGNPAGRSGKLTVQEAESAGILSKDEAAALQAAGIKDVNYKGSKQDTFSYGTLVIEAQNPGTAGTVKQSLTAAQTGAGMVAGAQGALAEGKVVVHQRVKTPESGVYRALYVSGNNVIRVMVSQEPVGKDDKELIPKFQEYAVKVAEAVAPS